MKVDTAAKLTQWALKSPRLLYSREFRRTQLSKCMVYLFGLAHGNVEYYGIKHEGALILAFARDKFVTRELLEHGHYQRKEFSVACELLQREGYGLGGCFVDVGANIGMHTVYALQSALFSCAISIEPEPENNRLLHANICLNGYQDRVTVLCAAVGDREGTVALELSRDNFGDHRVSEIVPPLDADERFDESRRKRIEVRLARLDVLVSETQLAPADISLIWVDTQGFEAYVLAGAKKTLEVGPAVVLEIWPYALRRIGGFDLLPRLVTESFAVYYDLADGSAARPRPAKDVNLLLERLHRSDGTTDILLLPLAGSPSEMHCGFRP